MIVIGLTGSIAMGKSEVARIFRALDIPVFDADAEVHRLYDSNDGVRLLQPFVPEAIVHGKIDRAILSRLVLADRPLLDRLEKIVHGKIAERRQEFLAEARSREAAIAVLDIPLLFETGADKSVDNTIVVSAPEALQEQRALARPGMTAERLAQIRARQMADADKRRRADFILENDGSLQDLEKHTRDIVREIRKEHTL